MPKKRIQRKRVVRHHRGRGIAVDKLRSLLSSLQSGVKAVKSKVGLGRKRKVHRKKHRKMLGRGFFGDLWSGIKRAVTRPSTWLSAASMLPTPLAPAFKVGSVVSGLTGNGRRKLAHKRQRGRGFGLMPIYRQHLMGGSLRMPNSLDPIA